jgi:MFS family permease
MTVLGPAKHSGRWIFLGIGIYGLATVLFAWSQIFWFSLLMLGLTGAGDTISSILRSTTNQLSTPDELRGRMSSINSIFTSSGPQLGQFESGVVAAWLGAQLSAFTGGLATLFVLVVVAASFSRLREFQIPRFSDR